MSAPPGSAEAYGELLRQTLPRGKAWPQDVAATLHSLLDGLADELARIHAALLDLVEVEADPRATTELLTDWERALGFPDECLGVPETLQERRAYVHQRYTDAGGQRAADLVAKALLYGFVITIDEGPPEFGPFRVGESYVGETPVQDHGWGFVFRVNAPAVTSTYFHVGESSVGEPLLTFGNEALECLINRVKPSHTIAQFVYA